MRSIRQHERVEIWWAAALAAMLYLALVVLAYFRMRALGSQPPERALVVAFFSVQMLIVFALSLRTLWTKGWDELSERYNASLRRGIREALARCSTGQPSARLWDKLLRRAPREFEEQWLHAAATLSGPPQQRLIETAREAGLEAQWWSHIASTDRPSRLRAVEAVVLCAAETSGEKLLPLLYDADISVQVLVGNALLDGNAPEMAARVFRRAIDGPPLPRLLLEPKLRRHGSYLCRYVLPALTPELPPDGWLAALELARVWRQPLTPEMLAEACQHPDVRVRRAALANAVEQEPTSDAQSRLDLALRDPDAAMRRSAAALAGKLGILNLIPALARELDSTIPENSVVAASALSELGPAAAAVLRRRLTDGLDLPRQSAMEALGRKQRRRAAAVCA